MRIIFESIIPKRNKSTHIMPMDLRTPLIFGQRDSRKKTRPFSTGIFIRDSKRLVLPVNNTRRTVAGIWDEMSVVIFNAVV